MSAGNHKGLLGGSTSGGYWSKIVGTIGEATENENPILKTVDRFTAGTARRKAKVPVHCLAEFVLICVPPRILVHH